MTTKTQQSERRLAAIMFADMARYTALMNDDEQHAWERRNRFKSILEESVKQYSGQVIQYYGDGALCIFLSGLEGVKCGIDVQLELIREKIEVRIGLHSGDVVYDEHGAYGDGVNIASRIETLACPGSVLFSEKIYDEIQNHPQIKYDSLGFFTLKNVKKPMEVFAIKETGLSIPGPEELAGSEKARRQSIAVLPFVNMSTDLENEYFSDGITEEIINALAKLENLRVTSRTSAFAFKNINADVREIGRKLGVDRVLEGSVRKAGNRVRITAQLINTADGYHQWSETYDRKIEDIFEVQDEISRIIANKMRERMSRGEEKEALVRSATNNMEAYNLYLKALFYKRMHTPDGNRTAIDLLGEAIKLEPDFALAKAQKAICHLLGALLYQYSYKECLRQGKQMAEEALKIDPEQPEAYVALAMANFYSNKTHDSEAVLPHLMRALELKPNDVDIRYYYATYLLLKDRLKEAINQMEIARGLDPMATSIVIELGFMYHFNNENERARKYFDIALEMNPQARKAVEGKGWIAIAEGKYEEGISHFLHYQRLTGDPLKGACILGYAYAKAGNPEKAREYLQMVEKRQNRDKDMTFSNDYCVIYIGLDDKENALKYIREALNENPAQLQYVKHFPEFKKVMEDPEFKEAFHRTGVEALQ